MSDTHGASRTAGLPPAAPRARRARPRPSRAQPLRARPPPARRGGHAGGRNGVCKVAAGVFVTLLTSRACSRACRSRAAAPSRRRASSATCGGGAPLCQSLREPPRGLRTILSSIGISIMGLRTFSIINWNFNYGGRLTESGMKGRAEGRGGAGENLEPKALRLGLRVGGREAAGGGSGRGSGREGRWCLYSPL